jgi:hypothetical protein
MTGTAQSRFQLSQVHEINVLTMRHTILVPHRILKSTRLNNRHQIDSIKISRACSTFEGYTG